MTGIGREAPMGPPWPVEVLADLHAGALDESLADRLWPLVRNNPEARDVLNALDAVQADLADLPLLTMPDDVAARLDAAFAAVIQEGAPADAACQDTGQPSSIAPVVDINEARKRRNRRLGWGTGLLAAAAAVIGVVVAAVPGASHDNGQNVAGAASPSSAAGGPLALTGGQLANEGLRAALHKSNLGSLADPARLSACLFANDIAPNVKPIAATPVTLDGQPGELLVLPTGQVGRFRLLVVGPACGTAGSAKLADVQVGGSTSGSTINH